MKILKRNYGHRNLMFFLGLSLVYLQAVYSLSIGKSLFSLALVSSFLANHYLILSLTLFTAFMILKIKKFSALLLLACLIVIVGKSFFLLSSSFNKLTLVLNFVYLVFAFYFFITWEQEVGLASYNPKFSKNDLEKETRFNLQAKLLTVDDQLEGVSALITNIDEASCFLLLQGAPGFRLNPSRKYLLESTYEGVRFQQIARVVSSYDRGVGLVFNESPDSRYSWKALYKVCLERGIMG